jgi:putative ATP-binding cassette transporter
VLVFVLLGVLLFVRPSVMNVDQAILTGFVLTLLFLTTLLEVILNALPTLSRAQVAADKVDALGLSLAAGATEYAGKLDYGQIDSDQYVTALPLASVAMQ